MVFEFPFTFLNRFLGAPRNGVFFALVFVTLGAMLAQGIIKPIRGRIAWLCLAASLALSFAEVWQIRRSNAEPDAAYCALQLALLPATYCWFSALGSVRMQPRPIYKTLRRCSTLIYCLHPMILLLTRALKHGAAGFWLSLPFAEWILVYALSFCAALAWVRLEENPRFRFLRRMH